MSAASWAQIAAVFALLILGLNGVAVSAFAFGGALLIAILVYLLAYRGGLSGYRFVLIGIGLAAVMSAVVEYQMTRATVEDAQNALVGHRLCENTVGLLEEKGVSSWTSPGASDKTEWVN